MKRIGGKVFGDRALLKAIFLLAWPAILEQAFQTIVQYADSAMVGRLGATASATVGLTATMMWLINSPFYAMGIGALACISRSFGAGDGRTARTASVQAMIITAAVGTLVGIITLAISPVLPGWMGAAENIRQDASMYFAVICLPMWFRAAGIIQAAVLRASGDTKTPMLVNVVMNLMNVVLNFFMIYGTREIDVLGMHLWCPGFGWGVLGAGIATAISFTFGGVMMIIAVWRNPRVSFKGEKLRVNAPVMKQCIRVGFPVALERMGACLGQVVFSALVTSLGTVALATHSIAITAEQAFYIPGYGMQAAAATLSGNALGARDEKRLEMTTRTILLIAVAMMTLTGGLLFAFPEFMMSLFTSDRAVIEGGIGLLRIVAVSEPLFAALIIFEGVFNGVGDTKAPFVFSILSMWGIRIFSTFLCVKVFHMGLTAVWFSMVADNVTRCLLLGTRYATGRWKKRIEWGAASHQE